MSDTFVASVAGETLLIQIGDGDDPEVFAHDCLINANRGFEVSAEMAVAQVANCTDPSKPHKTVRRTRSVDTRVPFSGMLHAASAKVWVDWAMSGQPKNIQVKQNLAGASGGWTAAGPYLLESFSVSGDPHEEQTCQGVLVQAAPPAVTANS